MNFTYIPLYYGKIAKVQFLLSVLRFMRFTLWVQNLKPKIFIIGQTDILRLSMVIL